MRVLIFLLFFISYNYALNNQEAKHLLNRVYFGYTSEDLNRFLPLNKKQSIELLLKEGKNQEIIVTPKNIKEVSTTNKKFKELTFDERKKIRKSRVKKMKEVSIWWNKMMLDSKFAFREKMVLFWHSILTSEYKVVKNPYMMYSQNSLYRTNAIGNFSELIHKSSKDLAMLVYLDSNSNVKKAPNENYARELMELFTLGEGYYKEEDIQEAARSFTGWKVRKKNFIFKKVKKHHDAGLKKFLNMSGNFDGEDIIDIILKQERCSEYIVTRLYKTFIKNDINKPLIKTIAKEFRKSNYEIQVALKALLLSEDFWKKEELLVKSPVEFTLGAIKQLGVKLNNKEFYRLLKVQQKLGQELFNPPSVKGWNDGISWIDTSSLIYRQKYIKYLVFKKLDKNVSKKDYLKDFKSLNNYFFALPVKEDIKYKKNRKVLSSYLTKLEYQVK